MTDPVVPPEGAKEKSVGSSIMSGLKKVGHAVDSGVSSFMSDLGGTVKTDCPECHKSMKAHPNTFIKCPHCSHEFTSPTAVQRSVEVTKELSADAKKVWEKESPKSGA